MATGEREREKEREREREIYIYIYIYREREREKVRERISKDSSATLLAFVDSRNESLGANNCTTEINTSEMSNGLSLSFCNGVSLRGGM